MSRLILIDMFCSGNISHCRCNSLHITQGVNVDMSCVMREPGFLYGGFVGPESGRSGGGKVNPLMVGG